MRQFVSKYRLSSIQNAMSAVVFGVLLTAQLSAFLLYLNPRSEWLWFLSVKMNRIGDPALQFYDRYVSVGPLLSCALLAVVCAVPLLAQAHRSWLGAFVSGHLALLICVSSAVDQLNQTSIHYSYASLDSLIGAVTFSWTTTTVITATAILLATCILNQFFYWKASAPHWHGNVQEYSRHRSRLCLCKYSMIVCYLRQWARKAASFHAARRLSAANPA